MACSIEECTRKIAHYQAALTRDMMKGRWYELCLLSITEWELRLQRAKGEILFAYELELAA